MRTILVDDEQWGLERFEIECESLMEIELLGKFQDPNEALALAREQRVDLALLDIQMPQMNGMDLSDALRELYPDIIIIFISAYEEHFKEAMKNRKADYFLLKPYTAEEVQEVLDRARLLSARQRKRVTIHTFGVFSVYIDRQPLVFTSKKAQELLAILVDAAGEAVTGEEAFSLMWETIPYNHTQAGRYRRTLQKLQAILTSAGIENILSYFPHARAIRTDMVECDYFDFLAERKPVIQHWNGYYMTQYSWAEERYGKLLRLAAKHTDDAEALIYD